MHSPAGAAGRDNILPPREMDGDDDNDSDFNLPDLNSMGAQLSAEARGSSAVAVAAPPHGTTVPNPTIPSPVERRGLDEPITNETAARILSTLHSIQMQLTEIKANTAFIQGGQQFGTGAAGLPPGVLKPRNIGARLEGLRILKEQGVPHGDALVLYYDVPEQTARKIIQLTVYIWMSNLQSASLVWIGPETYQFLQATYNDTDMDISECSGLALLLFARRKNGKGCKAYGTDLGQMYVTMTAQVALGMFGACRQELFRSDSKEPPYYNEPKWGRPVVDPPRYIRADFVRGLVKGPEFETVRKEVEALCKSATAKFEYETSTKSNKRRRTDAQGVVIASQLDKFGKYHRTPTMKDCADLTHRANVTRYINRAVREGLNAHRSKVRTTLYRQFFFILRVIQSAHPNGPPSDPSLLEKEGFYVEWPVGAVTPEALEMLADPTGWEIPLAHSPTETPDAYDLNKDLFKKELAKNKDGQKGMFVNEKLEINFHGIALSALTTFLLTVPADLTGPTLALSPLSLRAVHIWALALRAMCISIAGGPSISHAEGVAVRGTTTKEKLGVAEEKLSFIMLGAYDINVTGSGRIDKQKHRKSIDLSLTTLTYAAYLEKKAARETANVNPHLGIDSPTNPDLPVSGNVGTTATAMPDLPPTRLRDSDQNGPEFNLTAMMG